MNNDVFFWDYTKQPGLKRNKFYTISEKEYVPLVSIVTSYYNSQEFMWQTINCVLNQSFPFWEWIIVDDGSNDEKAIEYLNEVKKIDFRIKVFHKENEGLAKGRDYAISKSTTDYILPLDADDLIEPTYIESAYWSLKTNPDASWAFTNSVGFGKYIYLSNVQFDSEKMKTENHITATALIKRAKIIELSGYGVAKRYVNEDWFLWLRMLAKDYFPVQINYYGFWYRRRDGSLLTDINDEKKKENELRLQELKNEADKIRNIVKAKIYPIDDKSSLEYRNLEFDNVSINLNKEAILYIVDQIGYDKKFFKKIIKESNNKTIYIVSVGTSETSNYCKRQDIERYATVFDLTAFIDRKFYIGFVEYLVKTRKIKEVFIQNDILEKDVYKKSIMSIKDFEYRPSKKRYNIERIKYRINRTIIFRAIRKILKSN